MATRPFKYVPFNIRETIKDIRDSVQELNYRYEIYDLKRESNGISYSDFHLSPPGSDILLQEILDDTSAGDVVYDVGANVGRYSLPLAIQGCEVCSFEPHPETFIKLQKNIRVNELDNVECFNIGLSDSKGELTFYRSSNPTFSSFNEYNAEFSSGEIISETQVETTTIDDMVSENRIAPPTHIKIDVEGLGFEVLKGGRETIEEYTPIIYFEPHKIRPDGDRRVNELRAFFEELGYEIDELEYPWVCKPTS